jgi:type VI secretion system protein ImpH
MADLTNKKDIASILKEEGYFFNFFQVLQLLEEKYRKETGSLNPLEDGLIRCSPDSSLVFPPNDIKRIDEKNGVFHLTLTFMGLVGVSSPLPLYFSEYVARHEDNAGPLLDFLDIFNHRCYTLFYRAWKKYRVVNAFSKKTADPLTHRVALLAGLDLDRISDPAQLRLLAYTGLLAGKCRGKSGLSSMLSDFFNGTPVSIQEYMPRWVSIANPKKIGVDVALGVNSIAGTTTWDLAGKFRVCVGPLKREAFETFLPGTDNIKKMKALVETFLADPLAFDIEVKLQSCELVPVILGTDNTRIGETSSLGNSSQQSDIKSIVIE